MVRALTHVGLAILLVIAPALCCCNARLLASQLAAAPAHLACPLTEPLPPSCCHVAKVTKKKSSCCRDAEPPANSQNSQPIRPAPTKLACCERPDAMLPEAAPSVADPEPTGELLPVAAIGLAAVAPEHLGLLGGLDPAEWAGVDARSAALFDRHVLRC